MVNYKMQMDGIYACNATSPTDCRALEKTIKSNEESTITDPEGHLTSRRCIGNRVLFTDGSNDRSYKIGIGCNHCDGERRFGLIAALGLLIFFYLQPVVFILAATTFFRSGLHHAAICTGMCFFYGKVPVSKPAHAVMQVYRGAYGGAQVKNSYYEYQELFHNGVKVAGIF
jgi:hypothetical protein